jgi:transmembrane sensor
VSEYPDEGPGEATERQRIDMRAAEYVERRDSDAWTPGEEAELDIWLNQASAHRVAFLRLNASWKRTDRLVTLRSPRVEPMFPRRTAYRQRPFKFAVALGLAIALGGAMAWYVLTPRYDTYATTVGGRETLTLRDGSRIEQNTDTVVRVAQIPGRRLVRLDKGEAFFQIRHDPSHPFVVVAAGHRLVDLGTKFSVRAEAGELKVALVEGSVRVETGSGQNERTLSPGEILLATAGNLSVKRRPLPALTTALAWRRGMLVFHETTLLDAAKEFNRYNETKIVIRDPNAARETINGTLPANDLEEFSRMARNIFGLKTERRGNEILFTR